MSSLVATEHPHIVRDAKNRPLIRGTRILVQTVIGYYRLGYGVEEILSGLPHLTPAQVYDALSFYHDHQDEIEAQINASENIAELLDKYNLKLDEQGRVKNNGHST